MLATQAALLNIDKLLRGNERFCTNVVAHFRHYA